MLKKIEEQRTYKNVFVPSCLCRKGYTFKRSKSFDYIIGPFYSSC